MATTIRFLATYYAVNGGGTSYIKYQAGETYPADEETTRLAASGIAEVIEVDDESATPPSAPVEEQSPGST